MINFLDKNNKLNECKNTLNVSYPRNIQIIYGNYPYPEIIHEFIIKIKNNLNPEMKNYTHVKGGMTDWNYFTDKLEFNNLITYLINKHQSTNPELFGYFLERRNIINAWGNEIKKGDNINYHTHPYYHGILYLTKGCDLILPELNLKITPEPGEYYIFPPEILHGVEKTTEEKIRYSLVFNIQDKFNFDFMKRLNEK
jgi:hypothetical protein